MTRARLGPMRRAAPEQHAGETSKRWSVREQSIKHYYANVPDIGNVAVSRHAQNRLAEDGISERKFEAALLRGDSVPEGQEILWRQKDGVPLVILLKPEPFRGATLVKTAYRIEPQAKATS